eukprot:m.192458 g.192458  ORF g.192458 m.192458 type:complete len:183 (+) comp39473_c1_seq1:412-960(+)
MLVILAGQTTMGFFRRALEKIKRFFSSEGSIWSDYKDAVKRLCAESSASNEGLLNMITSIAESTVGPVTVIFREIPNKCNTLARKILAKERKMKSDIQYIKSVLKNCQGLQVSLSLMKMSLEFHDYDESEVTPHSQPFLGLSEGSTKFSKVKTPDIQKLYFALTMKKLQRKRPGCSNVNLKC